jgi:hypothetical protein
MGRPPRHPQTPPHPHPAPGGIAIFLGYAGALICFTPGGFFAHHAWTILPAVFRGLRHRPARRPGEPEAEDEDRGPNPGRAARLRRRHPNSRVGGYSIEKAWWHIPLTYLAGRLHQRRQPHRWPRWSRGRRRPVRHRRCVCERIAQRNTALAVVTAPCSARFWAFSVITSVPLLFLWAIAAATPSDSCWGASLLCGRNRAPLSLGWPHPSSLSPSPFSIRRWRFSAVSASPGHFRGRPRAYPPPAAVSRFHSPARRLHSLRRPPAFRRPLAILLTTGAVQQRPRSWPLLHRRLAGASIPAI